METRSSMRPSRRREFCNQRQSGSEHIPDFEHGTRYPVKNMCALRTVQKMARPRASSRPEGASAPVLVRVLTTIPEFAALAPEWDRIHEKAAAASIFNSWLWLFEWWRIYGGGRPLRILEARQAG